MEDILTWRLYRYTDELGGQKTMGRIDLATVSHHDGLADVVHLKPLSAYLSF